MVARCVGGCITRRWGNCYLTLPCSGACARAHGFVFLAWRPEVSASTGLMEVSGNDAVDHRIDAAVPAARRRRGGGGGRDRGRAVWRRAPRRPPRGYPPP